MEIKIGSIFEKEHDGECNGNWMSEYIVTKVTSKTVTVQKNGESITRKIKAFSDGRPYICLSNWHIATLRA